VPDREDGFTPYSGPFGEEEHHRLMRVSLDAYARGCLIIHTKHNTDAARRLYDGMAFVDTDAHRWIGNRHSEQRTARELIGDFAHE